MVILKNLRHEKNVPTQNQFVEGREKGAPRESKQNIKCTQNTTFCIFKTKVKCFFLYSNRLVLFMFLKKLRDHIGKLFLCPPQK